MNKMKKIILFIASLMLLCCAAKTSDSDGETKEPCYDLYGKYPSGSSAYMCRICVVSIKGHEYIVARYGEALSIVHAASCQCLQKKDENPFTTTEETSNDYNW